LFRFVIDFAGKLDALAIDLRLEFLLEITPFSARYLCGDAKGHSCRAGDANCSFWSFLGRKPAKESKI
jgi:hypothetical protein